MPQSSWVLLSAGVPEKFLANGIEDTTPHVRSAIPDLIREAVLAFVSVCKERSYRVVFGGHPAISPLVHHAAERLDFLKSIRIYQSEFFLVHPEIVPEAAWKFPNLIRTQSKGSIEKSLEELRSHMISYSQLNYSASVFIGGKQGIVDEFNLFGSTYINALRLPLYSPGGAARELFDQLPSRAQITLSKDKFPEPKRPSYKELFRESLPKP